MNERLTQAGFVPMAGEDAFYAADDLINIDTIVSLGDGTCTNRAAHMYCEAQQENGRNLHIQSAGTFEKAIHLVRNNIRAAILVPQLHQIQQTLESKPHYRRLDTQLFQLPNPGLHIATPIHNSSERTYLYALPTLVPLVEEQYDHGLPFEEVVPAKSTQDAAFLCSRIFGGAYCVTNDEGLKRFELRPVQALRHIVMKWFLYRKNTTNK